MRRFRRCKIDSIINLYIINNHIYWYDYCHMDTKTPHHYFPLDDNYNRMKFCRTEMGRKVATMFKVKYDIIWVPDGYEEVES